MPLTGTAKQQSRDVRVKLLEALSEIDRPGDVCASGDRPLTMPGLEVHGLGTVGLPLGKSQARRLIALCRQAPYGKGTETVVDTNVRRVWELDAKGFELTNPKWDGFVTSVLADVQAALGLAGEKLEAQLYKLLVYEEGSFFLPHRDGEKLDRMVATLVIGLPSRHEGGELIVWHEGRKQEVVFRGAASGHELSYAAFYADCQHEVRPVRSGYRLCLTYNVTLAKSRGKKALAAPSYGTTATAIGELLVNWRQQADAEKIAITLEHRYTQDGLAVDKLKGIDRARAEVLFEAAGQADCVAHLALLTLWQSGSAEGGYDDYSYGRGRGYSRSDDEDEEEDYDETTNEYEMGEVYESSLSADHWTDQDGKNVRLGTVPFRESEIVAAEAWDETEPNREDFEGFTGNAGMTLERWYHRAAVVIWPRAKHFHVLCGAGTDAAVGGLEPMVKRLKRAPKKNVESQRQECLAFATAIIDSWQPGFNRSPREKSDVDRNAFSVSLCELAEPDLVCRFLSQVMPADGTVQVNETFASFCNRHGWATFEQELTAVFASSTAATIARNAELLRFLCESRDTNAERTRLCTLLSEQAVKAVEAFDIKPQKDDWRFREADRAAMLGSLVKAMLAINAEQPLTRLLDHAWTCRKYDLIDAHLPTIFALEQQLIKTSTSSPAISHWLRSCRGELESRTAEVPRKPTDYRRAAKLSCACSDCRALAAFLADPKLSHARFPLAKHRRQHLHQAIDRNHCDCTHVTERRGSPHTLVCTKTMASYEAARKIHDRDLKHLARVVAITNKTGGLS